MISFSIPPILFLKLLEDEKYEQIVQIESKNPVILSVKTLAYAKMGDYEKCISLSEELSSRKYIPSFKFVEQAMFDLGDLRRHLQWKNMKGSIFEKYDDQTNEVDFLKVANEFLNKNQTDDLNSLIRKLKQFDRIDVLLLLVGHFYRSALLKEAFYFLNILLDICLDLDKIRFELKEVEIYDVRLVMGSLKEIMDIDLHKDGGFSITSCKIDSSVVGLLSSSLEDISVCINEVKIKLEIFFTNQQMIN